MLQKSNSTFFASSIRFSFVLRLLSSYLSHRTIPSKTRRETFCVDEGSWDRRYVYCRYFCSLNFE